MIDGLPIATRADEMAIWLKQYPICGVGHAEDITGKNWKSRVNGRTGIIVFSNYWGKNQNGGHIDLWDKTRFTLNPALVLMALLVFWLISFVLP